MKKFVDLAALALLLLNLSEAVRAVGVLSGVQSSQMSMLTIAGSALYLIARFKPLMKAGASPLFKVWLAFIFIYPTVWYIFGTLMGHIDPSRSIYWIANNFMYYELFLVATVFAYTNHAKRIEKLALTATAVIVLGFVVNFVNYGFTRRILIYSDAVNSGSLSLYRPMSFFGHPNTAAFSILIILVLTLSSFRKNERSPVLGLGFIILAGALILITGSRTSLLLWVLTTLTYALPLVVRSIRASRKNRASVYAWGAVLAVVMALFFTSTAATDAFTSLLPKDTAKRMSFLMGGGGSSSSTSSVEDKSASVRAYDTAIYMDYIAENPISGYGDDFVSERIESHDFLQVSQNAFLEYSLILGIPYAALFVYAMIRSFRLAGIPRRSNAYSSPYAEGLKVLIGIFMIASWSIVGLFFMRAVCIGLGLMLGSVLRELAGEKHEPRAIEIDVQSTRQIAKAV